MLYSPAAGEFKLRWQHLIFHLYTLFSCVREIVLSCRCVQMLDLALWNNSSSCVVLIPHRQPSNYSLAEAMFSYIH